MNAFAQHPSVRRTAAALLLVSVGVIVGSYAPARGSSRATAPGTLRQPVTPRPRQAAPPAPAQPRGPAADLDPGLPPAPGYESVLAGSPRPEFGGEYAVLRGAETAGQPAPQAAAPPVATIPSAPSVPVSGGDPPDRELTADPSARPAPEPFRPSPAQGIPRGIALSYPLLAVARPGGRVALHDMGLRGGPTPAAIEGEWAVIGRCGDPLRLEFALPTRRAGELRAIGRAESAAGWTVEPVVARQACAPAAERYARSHPASTEERGAFGAAGAEAGFAPGDLAQVAQSGATALLVFRGSGGGAVIAAARGPAGPVVVWSYVTADGDPSLLGVYRTGAGTQAWILLGGPGSPRALLTASTRDGRSWSADGPFSLQDH